MTDSDTYDERCPCYVGMARARHQLIITYTVGKHRQVSRFVVEAGLMEDQE